MTFGERTVFQGESVVDSLKKDRFFMTQKNAIESFAIHESYQPWNGANFDVCLIKTSKSIYQEGLNNEGGTSSACITQEQFENGETCRACGDGCVNAACLPTEAEKGGKACWIAGWGSTTEEHPVSADTFSSGEYENSKCLPYC